MTCSTPSLVRGSPALLLSALLAMLLTGCDRDVTPTERAQAFWDAVAQERFASAREQVLRVDDARQLARIEALDIDAASVEHFDVPPEAEVALLPTRIERSRADLDSTLETVTVLRRNGDDWRVDLDATLSEYRSANMAAVGDRVRDAAGRLTDALGRHTGEVGAALRELGRELGEALELEGERNSQELAEELGRRLESAGEALVRGLEEMEQALDDAAADRQARQGEEGRGDQDDHAKEAPPG